VTDWTPVFLGIIALSVLAMAVVQVGVLVYGTRLARRVNTLTERVEREVTPVFAHLQTMSAEAARASTLAAQQVERADRLFADVAGRLEETAAAVQTAVIAPAREGLAVLAGLRAAAAAGGARRAARTRRRRRPAVHRLSERRSRPSR
jgi:hypothetical protein